MLRPSSLVALSLLLALAACGDDDMSAADAGTRDAPGLDAPGVDAPGTDAPAADAPGTDAPGVDAFVPPTFGCGVLPPSTGTEMRIGPDRADELPQIVQDAPTGTVILLEDGTYRIGPDGEGNRRLQFHTPGVTLRSVSNDATTVILDGEYRTNETIFIDANDVTIAHITVTHAVDHGIHVTGAAPGNTERTILHGLRMIDHGEQFVKVNANGERTAFVDNGVLACSYFELTDAGRPNIERSPGGCYTGGIDAHSAQGWHVYGNRFEDIYCAGEGLAEHAIHFWSASRDTLVEHNVILNCARGIGFGLVENGRERDYDDNPYPGVSTYIGHYDGIIRGNSIYADINFYDTGIELAQARGARVLHNSVVSSPDASGFFSSIDYRFESTDVEIRNNLVRRITRRNDAAGTVENNLEAAPLDLFVDPAAGDLHLRASAAAAIDQGVVAPGAGLDIDGETRDNGAPDLGADER